MNQLIKGNEEIQWWLNRAISYIKPYIGEVVRYVQIDQENQLKYYQPGKVFQWVNFTVGKIEPYQPTEDDKSKNVVFHIIGQTCRPMTNLSRSVDTLGSKDVIFGMGTEFLCCKSQYYGNQQHIYLREIRTGFGSNTVLWVDDELFANPGAELNENQKLLYYIYH